MIPKEFNSAYDPKKTENKIYKLWEKSDFFNPDKLPKRYTLNAKRFSVMMAPPNITGSLHMGHALENTMTDILVRMKRMQGFKALWLPGTDHAGIAGQNVVEKELRKKGIKRQDLGREKFLEKMWEWKEKYNHVILDQLKKLGVLPDWSRTKFTLSPELNRAVEAAFAHYYKKGWLYRGERVINWCPRCETAISDLEIEYREEKSKLYYIKYPLFGESGFITVATTRPETMLGDAAVAINPKDKRYKNLIGKFAILPIQNRKIPIIADMAVDINFGTGAVKVTPAHDVADFEISQRHNLEKIQIIDEHGRITKEAGPDFENLKADECRNKVIEKLTELGLLQKTEDYTHNVGYCERCGTKIEPRLSKQWFLKMDQLAKLAIDAIKKKETVFHPKKWEKSALEWLKNVRDWNVSRQLWWGHKIPLEGETDVLDTWFSSALWPFSTLGWPQKTKDLETYYPTNFITSAREILNLWIIRMIFSGKEFTGRAPFKDVYIHGTILTKDGKRMSKSLGTGVDPLLLIDKYGADATRFGLIYQNLGNQDIRFSEDAMVTGKKFCNKIWNASRYVQGRIENSKSLSFAKAPEGKQTEADKIILKKLKETTKETTRLIEKYEFGKALHKLYDFFWHDFCDVYIEKSKNQTNLSVLPRILTDSLKLLHPFLPFITEEIWEILNNSDALRGRSPEADARGRLSDWNVGSRKRRGKLLMIEEWPK